MGEFLNKLESAALRNDSMLCLGLDPDPAHLPAGIPYSRDGVIEFNRLIIEATSNLVCAYKPNLAFYEALGSAGVAALEATVAAIPSHIPTIADAKRGDIGNTARMYSAAVFDTWGFDSVTVNPYLGIDSLEPFFAREGKGVWVVCRTSNAGGGDFQSLRVENGTQSELLFESVIRSVLAAPGAADVGLVIGATAPAELIRTRSLAPTAPLLIPGVGAQGGDVRAAVQAGATGPVVINASRSVLYGPPEGGLVESIRSRAAALRDELNASRRAPSPA